IAMYISTDGGKTFKTDGNNGLHPDQHALWIDPKDGRHMIVGTDGGFYVTYDRMKHWDHHNHLALGQYYHVTVDSKHPYHVSGALPAHGTRGRPARGFRGAGPSNDDGTMVFGGDGFVARVDPQDSDLVYFEMQDGRMGRRNMRPGAVRIFALGE